MMTDGAREGSGSERTNVIRRGGLALSLSGGGVWLENSDGSVPDASVVQALLDEGGVGHTDEAALKKFLEGENRVLVSPSFLPVDAKVKVAILNNAMTASISVSPPSIGGQPPSAAMLEGRLTQEGVVHGVDAAALRRICDERIYGENVEVAAGTPAIHGDDAEVTVVANIERRGIPTEDEAGNVDLKNLGAVNLVNQGDVLAVKKPATSGIEGKNVKGAALGTKGGTDKPFPAGTGTEVSEDGLSLLAAVQGHLAMVNGRLFVLPVFEVNGDVDYSTGNIDFPGSVVIRGVVKDGFEVKAAETITVYGVVEGALLKAGGDIVVVGGVRATGRGRLEAGGNIAADFADQANLWAGGDILIKNALLHSTCRCGGKLVVSGGKRAQIAGGKIQAGGEVVCTTLGSEMGTKTEIIVGVLPEQAERREAIRGELARSADDLEKAEKNVAFLKQLEADRGLDDEKRALLGKLTRAVFSLKATIKERTDELAQIESDMERKRGRGAVRARSQCYPGVYVSIRGVSYRVKEPFKFGAMMYDEGEIRVKPFDS